MMYGERTKERNMSIRAGQSLHRLAWTDVRRACVKKLKSGIGRKVV